MVCFINYAFCFEGGGYRSGRDTRGRVPPAQIRTCGITAYGSYLEYLASNLWLGYG